MGEFFNLYTFIAFALGVLFSAMVKTAISSARSKVGA